MKNPENAKNPEKWEIFLGGPAPKAPKKWWQPWDGDSGKSKKTINHPKLWNFLHSSWHTMPLKTGGAPQNVPILIGFPM